MCHFHCHFHIIQIISIMTLEHIIRIIHIIRILTDSYLTSLLIYVIVLAARLSFQITNLPQVLNQHGGFDALDYRKIKHGNAGQSGTYDTIGYICYYCYYINYINYSYYVD